MKNQNENQEESKLDNNEIQKVWLIAIETAKHMAYNSDKTEEQKELQEELLTEMKELEVLVQQRFIDIKKELTFCQTMICILSAKESLKE